MVSQAVVAFICTTDETTIRPYRRTAIDIFVTRTGRKDTFMSLGRLEFLTP